MSEEIRAGRELDALVAEKVMGKVKCTSTHNGEHIPWCYAMPESPDQGGELAPYSTDIAAAWEVVDKLTAEFKSFSLVKNLHASSWTCSFWHRKVDPEIVSLEFGFSPAEAICLGALKAVGEET